MVRKCLDLPYSSIRHFPAGTYYAQVATWSGRTELAAIETVHQAWYMFSYLEMGKWKRPELEFARWMNDKPEPLPRPHSADDFISLWWGASWWVMTLMGRRSPSKRWS